MKKSIAIFISLILSFAIVSCGEDIHNNNDTETLKHNVKTITHEMVLQQSNQKYNLDITYNDDIITGPEEMDGVIGTAFASTDYGSSMITVDNELWPVSLRTVENYLDVKELNIQPEPKELKISKPQTVASNGLEISYVEIISVFEGFSSCTVQYAFNITDEFVVCGTINAMTPETLDSELLLTSVFREVTLKKAE